MTEQIEYRRLTMISKWRRVLGTLTVFSIAVLVLAMSAKPANATTITEVAFGNGSGTTVAFSGSGTATLSSDRTGSSALAYSTDWIEFMIAPSSVTAATTVVDSVTPYPNAFFEIGTSAGTGNVVGPSPSNNTPVFVLLTGGVDYFVSYNSSAPSGTGSQASGIAATAVAAPESSSLVLLGFGLVGLLGIGLVGSDRR
jgi:hypothetical protein